MSDTLRAILTAYLAWGEAGGQANMSLMSGLYYSVNTGRFKFRADVGLCWNVRNNGGHIIVELELKELLRTAPPAADSDEWEFTDGERRPFPFGTMQYLRDTRHLSHATNANRLNWLRKVLA